VSYHHRREKAWGRRPKVELAVTAAVLVVVVGALIVFLFVYHDLPFRVSGP
jgi:hypothetical protein